MTYIFEHHGIDACTCHLIDGTVTGINQYHAVMPAQQRGWLAAFRVCHRPGHSAERQDFRTFCLRWQAGEAYQNDGGEKQPAHGRNRETGKQPPSAHHRSEP